MKAKFLALAALVLGLASCQTDTVNGVKVDANGEAPVTIQVGLPEEATRAAGADSGIGAIGNIDLVDGYDIRYILGVYDEGGELAKRIEQFEDESTSTTFDLRLVPGRHYRFVVWADFVTEGTERALHYDASDLKDIKLVKSMAENMPMDESRDAYTGVFYTADNNGDVFSSKTNVDMTLTRPFAKLRIVTTDMNELYSNLTGVTVTYTTDLYSTFNALTETADNVRSVQKVVTYGENTIYAEEPTDDGKMTLYADYLFGAADNKVRFTMDVTDETDFTIPQIVFNTDIPVQRNHLTTIYGPVLTDANNVTVTIEDDFAGEYVNGSDVDTTESFSEALKAAEESVEATIDLTGDVVWSTGAGIGSTPWIPEGAKTQKLTVNANGHKITATGAGVGAIRMANGGYLIINNAVIEDKSVSYAENSWEYGYLEFGGKLDFNNCTFVNAIQLEKANATFIKCSFNSYDDNQYGVWVCGIKAYFNECTFEGPRGLKVHEAYGSEVEEVVVDNTTFNNITKKPGIALGTLNAGTTITIKNSTFNNCQAGDQGLYIYETDTDVATFDFTEENNFVDGVNKADDDTYKISSAEGFEYIANMVNDGETGFNVVLNNDIDLSQYAITRSAVASNWTPIGASEKPFSGTFDGNGKTIKNLALVETEAKEDKAYIGFFGYAKDAIIKNVTFENVYINIPCLDIDHSQGHIGAVAGSLEGTSTIENVTVKGDIKVYATQDANGASRVAVVAGGNSYGNVTMNNVHVIADEGSYLIANNNTGALAGQLQGKMVFENCSSNIDVTVNKFFAGGLVGIAAGDSTFTSCHTTGDIAVVAGREGRAHDHYRVGGIAGGWADGKTKVCTLTNCSYTGKVSGKNADGSVANPLDYAGYVGRGYTLSNCAGSTVIIDGVYYIQKEDTVYGVYVDQVGNQYVANGVIADVNGIYCISSKAGMFWFANEVNVNKNAFSGKTVKLTANIDLNNEAWTPVGQTGATTFNGVFDGQNYTISNLNVNSLAQTGAHYSSGLFGWVESHTAGCGHIKNVKISGATISGHHNCGALVGYITQETALVENCHVTGANVSCTKANDDADGDKAGALIGNATVATPVKDCTAANSTVSAGRDAGQIIGAGKEANVTGCSATNVTVSANGTSTGANVRNEVIGRLLN